MPKKKDSFPGREYVQKNLPKAKTRLSNAAKDMKSRIQKGIKILGNAKTKEILPAAGWGLMDVLSGGKHTKHQNQKLADKVDDALGRPVRLARAKRAGIKPTSIVEKKSNKKGS